MSSFRDRAREVKAAGVEARADFTPKPNGIPLRMYQYWAKHTLARRIPVRENFCHFARVVMLWAPLMYFRRGTVKVFSHPVMIGVIVLGLVALFVAGLIMSVDMRYMVGMLVGIIYVSMGVVLGGSWSDDFYSVHDYFKRQHNHLADIQLLVWITGLVSFPSYLFIGRLRRHFKKFMTSFLLVGAGVIVWLASWGVYSLYDSFGPQTLAWLGGVVLAVLVGARLIYSAADYISGVRATREAEADRLHQEKVDAWIRGTGPNPGVEVKVYRRPGRIRQAVSGAGDMIVFIAQFVRVKKWKICPTVTIPTTREAYNDNDTW